MAQRGGLWEYYLTLGLEPGASKREIKQAYRALVKKWHPDQFNHDRRLEQLAEDKLKEINQAYAVLLNPESAYRRRYGRPSAGQQPGRASSTSDSQSWSATAGRFHYQSSYYRARQAKAAGGGSRRGPYASAYAAYVPGAAQNGTQVPRWAIMLVMFFVIAMVNTFTSSVLNGSSSRSYASTPLQPAASSRPQVTNFIPIVTMSEKELKEQKQRESRSAAGVHVPLILSDKEVPKFQEHLAAERLAVQKKDSHGSPQKNIVIPQDASAGK